MITMQIKMIPEDYIINATMKCMWTLQSDFVIKAIHIQNDASEPITISKIAFDLRADGRKVKEICYSGDALELLVHDFPDKVKNKSEWNSKVMIGTERFWDVEKLSISSTLEPNQQTGILNEFFLVVHNKPIDELILSISYFQAGELITQQKSIPVVEYKTKNNYTFPAKGVWQVNGNYDCIGAHRTQYSMEFAFDIGQLNSDSRFVYKDDMKDEDYVGFGKDILAIADGEVVDCFSDCRIRVNFPKDTTTDEKELEERKQMIEQFGYMPVQCGNYVVVKHANEEYSLYGHLLYHSLTVKKGDTVKQGQSIGKLGNTGKSGCPHLHFQLMNGPDYSTARGLTCHFSNIIDSNGRPLSLISEEYTIVVAK